MSDTNGNLGELLRAVLGGQPSTVGPPYVHTFTPEGDDEDGWPIDAPQLSMHERDPRRR